MLEESPLTGDCAAKRRSKFFFVKNILCCDFFLLSICSCPFQLFQKHVFFTFCFISDCGHETVVRGRV